MDKANTIHLINPLQNADGGSEWRTLELYRLLAPHAETKIWASGTPHPRWADEFPLNVISAADGIYPKGGVMVFVGCYYPIGEWVLDTKSERTVLIYNTHTLLDLTKALHMLSALGSRIELIIAAQWMLKELGMPGIVHNSPIDLARFTPGSMKAADDYAFVVGRLSRDEAAKHHGLDLKLYKSLVFHGCKVRIMGGTIWEKYLGDEPGIELLPTCREPAEQFIQGLDCFYYRTHDQWIEPSGRVIMEAMACGVPVVAYNKGGYTELIEQGKDGLLFDTEEQAFQMIMMLKLDPGLRSRIGKAARAKMESIFSEAEKQKMIDYYLRENSAKG